MSAVVVRVLRLFWLSLFIAQSLVAATARADDGARRRAIVDDAVRASETGDHAKALSLAESAEAIRATSSLTRFIAEQHEALGQAPETFEAARRCLRLAESEEPSANHDAVLVGCRSIAAEHRPRVGLVAVVLPRPPPPDLVVSVSGVVRDAGLGSFAVTPGRVNVEVRAPGWLPFTASVDVPAGAEVTVAATLAAMQPPPPEAARRGKGLVGPAMAGVGVLALAAAGVTRLVANGQYDGLRATCNGGCQGGVASQRSIDQLDGIALGTAIAGAGLVTIGATLFILDRPHGPTRAGAWLDVGPGGASVRGRFW